MKKKNNSHLEHSKFRVKELGIHYFSLLAMVRCIFSFSWFKGYRNRLVAWNGFNDNENWLNITWETFFFKNHTQYGAGNKISRKRSFRLRVVYAVLTLHLISSPNCLFYRGFILWPFTNQWTAGEEETLRH